MFSEILKRFIKDSPVAVMVRALLENLLNADKIDRWFEGVRQTRYWFSLIVLQAFDFKLDRRDEPHLNSQDLPPGKTFFQNTQSHGGDLLSGKVFANKIVDDPKDIQGSLQAGFLFRIGIGFTAIG